MALPSIAFVVPYFGRFPNYFSLFLHTAAQNPTIHWKFFSDAPLDMSMLPENVSYTPATLGDVRERARKVLGFSPMLPYPYKLCDYKPTYGLLFQDELRDFNFWGHCDIDMLLGNLRGFLTEEVLRQHIRLFMSGHLAVFRNSEESNNIFRLTAPGVDYREVFRDPRYKIFDEWGGMYLIHKHQKIPFYFEPSELADPSALTFDLRIGGAIPSRAAQIFFWQDGEIHDLWEANGKLDSREYMYLHLQKRAMHMDGDLSAFKNARRWYITGRHLIPAGDELPVAAELRQMNPRNIVHDFYVQAARPLRKVRRLVNDWMLTRQYPGA